MEIDLISQGRENVLFSPSNMAAVTSHENALYVGVIGKRNVSLTRSLRKLLGEVPQLFHGHQEQKGKPMYLHSRSTFQVQIYV